ncbi:MAG: metallophosphoesterase [Halobacteriota archaeon]
MSADTKTVDVESFEYVDRALYLPDRDVLAVSDLHVGIERAAHDRGVAMPLMEAENLERDLRALVEAYSPSEVVFNGDVHHEFGSLGDDGDVIRRLESAVESHGAEAVFVEGNHDTMLDSVVETKPYHEVDGVVFVHGDRVPVDLPDAPLYVVGHDHPAVEVEMQKTACYLYGPCGDGRVLMTPAFNELCRGVVVNQMRASDFMSPFVRPPLDDFSVVVEVDGEVLWFPRIGEFRGLL